MKCLQNYCILMNKIFTTLLTNEIKFIYFSFLFFNVCLRVNLFYIQNLHFIHVFKILINVNHRKLDSLLVWIIKHAQLTYMWYGQSI